MQQNQKRVNLRGQQHLVKGVATQMIMQESLNETKVKLLDIKNIPKSCTFRNEKNGKTFVLSIGDSLSVVDNEFGGISIVKSYYDVLF